MTKTKRSRRKITTETNNDEQELSINDFNLASEVDQWDKLATQTYETVHDERKYKKMKLDKFKRIIFKNENNKMIHGDKLPSGFDWDNDFITPMFQTFIDIVNIILYYFIAYYLI